MRYGRFLVYLLTAGLLAAALYIGAGETAAGPGFSVEVAGDDGRWETVACWERAPGEYCVFLPGYAELDRLRILGDGTLEAQEPLELDTPYALRWRSGPETAQGTVTFLRSQGLATLYLDVASGSMDYIHQEKGNEESGGLRLYDADGSLAHNGTFSSLRGRGNSTWGQEKKPYNLTLSQPADLLGMGAAREWVLLANAMDASGLRNAIVLDFAQAFGLDYTPEYRWVDLYLNGEYAGVYLLCERVEADPQRVDLSGAAFLVSKEYPWRLEAEGDLYFTTQAQVTLRVHDTTMTLRQMEQICQQAEDAILSQDGRNSAGVHWQELIDLDSWARKYLLEEVFANVDGQTLSQFFYYMDGTLCAGPAWDYDLSMGSTVSSAYPAANMFFVNKPDIWDSPWYSTLYRDQTFYDYAMELYRQEMLPLLTGLLETGIDALAEQIAGGLALDQLRWGYDDAARETAYIRDYMTERLEFLEEVWLEGAEYVLVRLETLEGGTSNYALKPGERMTLLDQDAQRWYNVTQDRPFDPEEPIFQDTTLKEQQTAAAQTPETWEEIPSPLRYGPALLFLLALTLLAAADAVRGRRWPDGSGGR